MAKVQIGSDEFMLQGAIFPTPDGPGFGTPVFRRSYGKSIYIQEFEEGHREIITGFYKIDQRYKKTVSNLRPNLSFCVGNGLQYAVRFVSGRIIIADKEGLIESFTQIAPHDTSPLLSYQFSIIAHDLNFLLDAMRDSSVLEAIERGEIDFPKFIKRGSGWNDAKVEILIFLWKGGISASRIGAILGHTRNAIIGKVHRLGLSSRAEEQNTPAATEHTAEKLPTEKRKGWWSLGR